MFILKKKIRLLFFYLFLLPSFGVVCVSSVSFSYFFLFFLFKSLNVCFSMPCCFSASFFFLFSIIFIFTFLVLSFFFYHWKFFFFWLFSFFFSLFILCTFLSQFLSSVYINKSLLPNVYVYYSLSLQNLLIQANIGSHTLFYYFLTSITTK